MVEATHLTGAVDRTTIHHSSPTGPAAVSAYLRQRARAALIDNVTFLLQEKQAPLLDDRALRAQVVALTKQVDTLIRLTLDLCTETTGS